MSTQTGGNSVNQPVQVAMDFGGTYALQMTSAETTYDLTGSETIVAPPPTISGFGTIKSKVQPDKDGKKTQFIVERDFRNSKQKIVTHETWKLYPDGKTIRFERSAANGDLHDRVALVLVKAS